MYQVMLYNKFLSFVVVWSSVSIMSEIIMPFSSLAQETWTSINTALRVSSVTMFVLILQVRQMQEHISSLQLSRCVGCHVDLSVADKLALASSLLQFYDHGHSFNRDILQTEFAWVWDMCGQTCELFWEHK